MSGVQRARVAVAAVLAVLFMLTLAPQASAVQSGRVTVSNSSVVCVQGESKFNWFTTGFADRSAFASTYARNPGSCYGTLYRPQGWLAVKTDVFKWTGSQWALCKSLPWAYGGGGDTRSGDLTFEQAAVQNDFYSYPPCGPGYYGAQAAHYVWNGSAWQGGSTWSGHTYAS